MGTELLSHNVTFRTFNPGQAPDFVEDPNSADQISTYLGAQSDMTLSLGRAAEIAYLLRHPELTLHEDDYLYGHLKYRTVFWFPTTKTFCFRYQRGTRGLPGKWVVCSR